jgi:hypothetical protein
MRSILLAACGTVFTLPVFGQSAPYFGKSNPPAEEVRTIKQPFAREMTARSRSLTASPLNSAEVEASTRRLIQSQLSRSGEAASLTVQVQPGEAQTRRVGNKWATTYNLSIANIPLSEASNISSLTMEDGSATVVRERNIPRELNFNSERGTPPTITVEKAERAARVDLEQLARENSEGADIAGLTLKKSRLEIWVDPRDRIGKLAWVLDMSRDGTGSTPAAAYRIWVDALAATEPAGVFEVKSLIARDTRVRVTGPVWDPTPLDPFQLRPLAKARIEIVRSQTPMSESAATDEPRMTDDNGVFDVAGLSGEKIVVTLQNEFFTVRNQQGRTATISQPLSNPHPLPELQFGLASEFEIAQPSAFYWANRVRSFVGDTLKDTDLLAVDLFVNADPECNATFHSDLNRVTLYRASRPESGRNCINKAYRDTVFHEFGHAIDHAIGGMANDLDGRSYSEGFGDALAILLKNKSCYGANHIGPETCLRDASAPKVMFHPPSEAIHERGRVYSGFTWELIQALKQGLPEADALATAKQLTLGAAAQNPTGIRSAVELTFVADDDDLDLTNGTPNAAAIKAAANARGIPLPAQLP